MSDETFFISRGTLYDTFGDMRAVRNFETMQERVSETTEAVTANVAATSTLLDASFLTLSANDDLQNERVLSLGGGLDIDVSETGKVILSARVCTNGSSTVCFVTTGDTTLALPIAGIVATTRNAETFENKTLATPSFSGLSNYADDAAASVGGVPIGGAYLNGSVLQVRTA